MQASIANPAILAVGLGEDTGAIIRKGVMEVIGSGNAVILDTKNIGYSDIADVDDGDPLTVLGIAVHFLGPGKRFSLETRKLSRY